MDISITTTAEKTSAPTLLQAYDHDLQQLRQRVGKDRAASTYIRQRQLRQHVADFLTDSLHVGDLPLTVLTERFIYDYAAWLSAERCYRGGTVWLSCQHLRGVVSRACQRGLLPGNPFYGFRIGKNIRPREYLTEQELGLVASSQLTNPLLRFHRDLFVFSALTGMSFADINRLRSGDIHMIDGEAWVVASRQKTHTPFQVRLTTAALAIVACYGHRGEYIFGPLKYRTLAQHVSRIMALCGISKHISFHCARHTFAVTALNAGMPIESVSRILGHTNITTTQIYARITMQKLRHDMDCFDRFVGYHILPGTFKNAKKSCE